MTSQATEEVRLYNSVASFLFISLNFRETPMHLLFYTYILITLVITGTNVVAMSWV